MTIGGPAGSDVTAPAGSTAGSTHQPAQLLTANLAYGQPGHAVLARGM